MADAAFVYCLEFPNGKKYVGVSSQPSVRLQQHARGGLPVGKAIRKHGMPVLTLLLQASRTFCFFMEQKIIEAFNTKDPAGYNLNGGGIGGTEPSEAARRKMSAWGRTEEYRQKVSDAKKGQRFTEEHRLKLSQAAKARPAMSEATREKLKARTGWTHSEETKQKLREKKLMRDRQQEV